MSSRSISSRRKNVYAETEDTLTKLKMLLNNQIAERDDLEMHQLFDFIKKNNISLDQAKNMMSK